MIKMVEDTREDELSIVVQYHGRPHTFSFPTLPTPTITDLFDKIASTLSVPPTNQKIMISPRVGLVKPSTFKNPSLPLSDLTTSKIMLMGSTPMEIESLNSVVASKTQPRPRVAGSKATANRQVDWKRAQEEALYTFTTLAPLPHLPKPDAALALLRRLKDDAGIKASMRKHKWTVPLLTEMDPVEHTTYASRTLGLNRNKGEVIELRLRTDAFDGYRDYKGIRKTLCHELAHNVWGEHDRNFWDLCKQIEREVETSDWRSGGRALTRQEYYTPYEEDHAEDHGAWTGGEYVLGSSGTNQGVSGPSSTSTLDRTTPRSRREILARAAEERMRRQRSVGRQEDEARGQAEEEKS